MTPGVLLLLKDHLPKGARGKSIKEYYFWKCCVNEKWPRCGPLTQLYFSGIHRESAWPWCLLISGPHGRTGCEDHESFHISSSSSGISFLLASALCLLPALRSLVGNSTLLTNGWYSSIQAPYPAFSHSYHASLCNKAGCSSVLSVVQTLYLLLFPSCWELWVGYGNDAKEEVVSPALKFWYSSQSCLNYKLEKNMLWYLTQWEKALFRKADTQSPTVQFVKAWDRLLYFREKLCQKDNNFPSYGKFISCFKYIRCCLLKEK